MSLRGFRAEESLEQVPPLPRRIPPLPPRVPTGYHACLTALLMRYEGLGNAYESYRTHANWPCKQVLEALLRNVPSDPGMNEAVVCVQALAADFSWFQEVFITYVRVMNAEVDV